MMKSTFFRSVVVAAIVATAAGVAAMADDIKFEICYDRNGPDAAEGCVTGQNQPGDASYRVSRNYGDELAELGYGLDGREASASKRPTATTATFLSKAAAVPDPGALLLFGSGILCLALCRRFTRLALAKAGSGCGVPATHPSGDTLVPYTN